MTGGIIALIIAVLALIVLTVFGLIVLKKVSHLMKEINKTAVTAQDKIDFFTKDTDAITAKLNHITQRANGLSTELNIKMEKINYFSETTTDFQDALDELKNSIERFFSGFFKFLVISFGKISPRLCKISKLAKSIFKTFIVDIILSGNEKIASGIWILLTQREHILSNNSISFLPSIFKVCKVLIE